MTQGVEIPITTPGGAQAEATLRGISGALAGVGDAAKATSAAFSFNEIRTALANVYGDVTRFAAAIGDLAAEQSRLDANSARLGLDFNAAADAAGRFTDETEAMGAATRLAEAGIRLSQEQLESLTRVAARFAQNTGGTTRDAIDGLTNGLITGSQRGLRPFGDALARTAGESHTAEDRLRALTEQAAHTEQATDDAATAMQRLGDSVDDMKRTLASAFASGINDTLRLAAAADQTGARFDILDEDIARAGRTIGTVVVGIGNGLALVVGGIATGIASMLSMVVGAAHAAGAVVDRLRSGNLSGLSGVASAAFSSSTADSPITDALRRFTEGRTAAAEAIFAQMGEAGESGATGAAARGARTPGVSMAARSGGSRGERFTEADFLTAEREKIVEVQHAEVERYRAQQAAAREYMDNLMRWQTEQNRLSRESSESWGEQVTHAGELARIAARIAGLEQSTTAASETRLARARMAQQRAEGRVSTGAEIEDLRDPSAQRARIDEMRQQRTLQRERSHLEQRYQMQRTYVDRMEELHATEADGTRALAEGVTGAFAGMGDAIATHARALLDGKEDVATALQGMLSDTLMSIAQQAIVKGAMETAEGVSALAGIVTAPLAPGHFAAAGLYFGVAALAGVGAAATAPSAAASTPSTASASAPREAAARVGKGSSSGGDGATVVNVMFGGPMYGTGGVRQAARQIGGVLNRGAIQGGVQLLPGALMGGGAGT